MANLCKHTIIMTGMFTSYFVPTILCIRELLLIPSKGRKNITATIKKQPVTLEAGARFDWSISNPVYPDPRPVPVKLK